MLVALFANVNKPDSIKIAKGVSDFLLNRQVNIVADSPLHNFLNCKSLENIPLNTIDFAITIGGDGTILRLAHHFEKLTCPILGINLGGLGFMADIPIDNIYPNLIEMIEGKCPFHEYAMIQGHTSNGHSFFALNDVVVHRGQNPCLVDLVIHVNGCYLNTFSADGIIISTPCGSTAYSLAAGGPILTPNVSALLLTPICPHTLTNRPIVLPFNQNIQIQHVSQCEPLKIAYDGISEFSLPFGETIHITPSHRTFKLAQSTSSDFFSTLRSKLGWSGRARNS